jgi:hypothetical protein
MMNDIFLNGMIDRYKDAAANAAWCKGEAHATKISQLALLDR